MVNGINDYEFQDNCVSKLIELTSSDQSKKGITVKAPTGAGKTVILIKYIDQFIKNSDDKTAFVWLCPGDGNLEEQSKAKMEELAPHIDARALFYSMIMGFDGGSVTFINWELVTNKKNTALRSGERANLFEKIRDAHNAGIRFVIIIDEEHLNNTKKADDIIESFEPKNIIRVSATAEKVSYNEYYEIEEDEVIEAGLISRAIYVNEGVDENKKIENDYDYLLDLADEKRKAIQAEYDKRGISIRPLVLIQFPAGDPKTIEAVEEKLASMKYTYDNKMVSKWMSDEKINIETITNNNGQPAFLLMKQAISTGWDCPRAKILVKLREGGSEEFQIQTIGRIRRMPERKHYGIELLDYCYLYTLDTKYKDGLLSTMDKAYQVRRLFLRDEARDFECVKELRNLDFDGLGERETLKEVYDFFKKKYHLGSDKRVNKENLEVGGYNLSHEIDSEVLQGLYRTINDISTNTARHSIRVKTTVNTHTHGRALMHSVDEIKTVTGIQAQKVKNILRRMFGKEKGKGKKSKYNFIALDNSDFYAFVINNVKQLKMDFKSVTSQMGSVQIGLITESKTARFRIPEMELYKYCEVKEVKPLKSNAYKEYTNEFITEKTRSLPERLFERYCDSNKNVKWVYKNGDAGQSYLSIVYTDYIKHQWLFYPDYIVCLNDGTTWLIETKGGEQSGHSKNIDAQAGNKFNAFKNYAEKYKLNWGFVRDVNEELFINNTEYVDDMKNDFWKPLSSAF